MLKACCRSSKTEHLCSVTADRGVASISVRYRPVHRRRVPKKSDHCSMSETACSWPEFAERQRYRHNRALTRRLKEAKLRVPQACLEDLDPSPRRGLERALVRQLATGRWIAEHHHVLITGATGVGKTYLACALGQQACRQGYRVVYRRVPRLFDELGLAHADGSCPHVLARFARIDVLVCSTTGASRRSPVSSRASSGTTSPPLPTPSSTASSTVRSRSHSPGHRGGRSRRVQ